ncbi:flavonol 3-sulfotransferase [Elaeis guineensis]|uniref:Sulfotransferase n=1 Tax=Elaeis guineensis var. tenera TaxID=51953 RepID=A0A6I9QBP7_ELAGV|nr:flavonol 3-sulfotransferase [Elaeis guineensis]
MAMLPSLPTSPLPPKPQEAQEDQECSDFISTLPRGGWGPIRTRKYQGFWVLEIALPSVMTIQKNFKPRPDDLFVVSYPKSGTTWLKAITFATKTRTQYPLSHHPLLSLNPHDCVLNLEECFHKGQASKIEALPSPRILAIHMPYSLLPDSMTSSSCRFVYICRDPKDTLVSMWHFREKTRPKTMEPTPFIEAFEAFCEGTSAVGPMWDHVLEYWRESQRRPEKVLFLKYEEMMDEPVGKVRRLAEFIGCPFSEAEEKGGVVQEIVKLCSFEKLKNLEANKTGTQGGPGMVVTNDSFFRKGGAGDWKNHMSPEMAQRLDGIAQQKLRESGLTLGSVGLEAASCNDVPARGP